MDMLVRKAFEARFDVLRLLPAPTPPPPTPPTAPAALGMCPISEKRSWVRIEECEWSSEWMGELRSTRRFFDIDFQ